MPEHAAHELPRASLAAGAAASAATAAALARDVRCPDQQDFAQIERGRYLTLLPIARRATTMPSGAPFAGGRPIETPFGDVRGAQHHPRSRHGHRQLERCAIRCGRAPRASRPDGKRLYPAMPFPYYTKMSREDVLAIRAYLNTVAPVHNAVEANQLPFPFNIRARHACSGMRCTSPRDDSSRIPRSRLRGIAAPIWSKARALRRLPYAEDLRSAATSSSSLSEGYSLQGWFAPDITDDHAQGLGELVLHRYRRVSEERTQPLCGRLRAHGRGSRRTRARR